jgi:hypothetical protein
VVGRVPVRGVLGLVGFGPQLLVDLGVVDVLLRRERIAPSGAG